MSVFGGLKDGGGVGNRAVLVSVAQYEPGVELGWRPGAKRDTRRLHRTLSKLGFKVELHMDLRADEIQQLLRKESRCPVKDSFLCVLSSHGDEGCVFGADGKRVQLSHVFRYFDNEVMEKKTKMFFIQVRGELTDDGVKAGSSVLTPSSMLFSGYGAFMNPQGSVFLQTLCSLLEEEEHRNLELTRLMTRLSHRVAFHFQARGRHLQGKKEMPCFLMRLTRDVFPFAEAGAAAGISATALVQPEAVRKRTRSIS
ncbi:caspase-7 [Mugil cephalus]|uniref:caspase-7 n=1 Tax=Mugil cephalus TaxID=48193 RepID=UPI001FB62C31|nr:caspase-7 [Mugil cephalus]